MPKTRVLLADDHPAMLEKVAFLLEDSCQIIDRATNGRDVILSVAKECPDVILMDISMPIMNGIEAAEQLIQAGTAAKIIFLTVHNDPDFVRAALSIGAAGYVLKSRIATDLTVAIREALVGHRFVSPFITIENFGA